MVTNGTIWYLMVPYGTIWYHMVPYGTLWYHMVPYGTIWYLMVPYGTIWYHLVPYNNKKQKYVPDFYVIFHVFQNMLVKKPNKSWRPNRVPPHPGRGTLWYHEVPYGTIRYLMVP